MDIIATNQAPAAIGPYSQAIKANGFVFCSGQIPLKADGSLESGGIEVQTTRVLENLKEVLKEAGSGLDSVVKTTVYLSDIEMFGKMNEVYAKYFVKNKPARATVQVAKLPKNVLVEIDCIAVVG
jgi:2-iminobutanoate/2-iminopropanoate deaminase